MYIYPAVPDLLITFPLIFQVLYSFTYSQMEHPVADLLGDRGEYNRVCVPLYQASNRGKWSDAEIIFRDRPDLVRYSITQNYETTLHIAVSAKYTRQGEEFVENLMGRMAPNDLQLRNRNGETALFVAAVAGYVQFANIMVNDQNRFLLTIPDNQGKMPLCMAALYGHREMVEYLYANSGTMADDQDWTPENREYVLQKCIEADLFDIALQIATDRPELATNGDALRILARKPQAFKKERNTALMEGPAREASSVVQLLRMIYDRILQLNDIDNIIRGPVDPTSQVQNPKYPSQMLFIAAEKGNTTFLVELIRGYPDLIRMVNDKKQSLFHVAVSYRHKDICTLLYQIGSIKDSVITLEDENGNNMLHLVGERANSEVQLHDVSGVVLQMQQELQWFEEVEAILPSSFQEMKNNDGLTPRELFTKTHKDLVFKGEKWLKDVAAQLMVVAALIATIAFAAPFSVPGGVSQETGDAILIHAKHFMMFMVLDAFTFLFASASIFVLISILTSRYAERDFLETLPKKLLICLVTLFNALMMMIATFFVNFFIINKHSLIGNVVAVLGLILILIVFLLQHPLFVGMFRSIFSQKPLFSRRVNSRRHCDYIIRILNNYYPFRP